MNDKVDSETIAIWGDEMVAALRGDRSGLVDMLRHDNKVTRDLAEFLAWLLEEKPNHRPPLPAKFKILAHWARNPALWDAFMRYEYECRALKAIGRLPPRKVLIAQIAKQYGVKFEALSTEVKRARNSPKRLDR
jgi:hypothetical protein